jgi:hypothetical protein
MLFFSTIQASTTPITSSVLLFRTASSTRCQQSIFHSWMFPFNCRSENPRLVITLALHTFAAFHNHLCITRCSAIHILLLFRVQLQFGELIISPSSPILRSNRCKSITSPTPLLPSHCLNLTSTSTFVFLSLYNPIHSSDTSHIHTFYILCF